MLFSDPHTAEVSYSLSTSLCIRSKCQAHSDSWHGCNFAEQSNVSEQSNAGREPFITIIRCSHPIEAETVTLAAATCHRQIWLIDPNSLQCRIQLHDCHSRQITDLQFFHNISHYFLSSSKDGFVKLWRIPTVAENTSFDYPLCFTSNAQAAFNLVRRPKKSKSDYNVLSCSVSCDDQLVAASIESVVKIFKVHEFVHSSTYSPKTLEEQPVHVGPCGTYNFHSDTINILRFHPTIPHLLFSGGDDSLVVLTSVLGALNQVTGVAKQGNGISGSGTKRSRSEIVSTGAVPFNERCILLTCFSAEDNVRILGFFSSPFDIVYCCSTTDILSVWQVSGLHNFSHYDPFEDPEQVKLIAGGHYDSDAEDVPLKRTKLTTIAAEKSDEQRESVVECDRHISECENQNGEKCSYDPIDLKINRHISTTTIREHPLVCTPDARGFIIEGFFDSISGRMYILGGSVFGKLVLFHVNLDGAIVAANFSIDTNSKIVPHAEVVRSAAVLCCSRFSTSHTIVTSSEDGVICSWIPS